MGPAPRERLAALHGIATEYYDVGGTRHLVPEQTLRLLLRAMGVDADDDADIERVIGGAEDEQWRRRLEPVCLGPEGDNALSLTVRMPAAELRRPLHWRLMEEAGQVESGALDPNSLAVSGRRQIDGVEWISTTLSIPAPGAAGYHRLALHADTAAGNPLAECLVILAPTECWRPAAIESGRRLWGLTAQLYGLRSQRNWGVGDFTDLLRLVEFAAANDAAFVGLNPLHSPLNIDDADASPYSPSSRMFLNALYLDVEGIPDFAESASAAERVADEQFQSELRTVRAAELIDYRAVGTLKNPVLELLFESFRRRHLDRDTARARLFRAFREERGESLYHYASFQVLHEYWCERDPAAWGWPAWPEEFRDCTSDAVAELVASRRERLEFHMYLQWNAELQLSAATGRAVELGMPLGIYADVALSSKIGGADTWIGGEIYMRGAHIGAPPDDFNQAGQDWGLPPMNPAALRMHGYRPFIETLRANMRIGGALRIDHVMSLMRCYLVPSGGTAVDGAYIYYAFDEMLAILALESQRHRCLVIGEDLGTVTDDVRQGLSERGVLGYRVLYFEKSEDGAYKSPADFDSEVLTVISTHDLPTLVGFWQGVDIEWRTEHDLFPSAEHREQQLITRAEDRTRLLVALEKQQLVPQHAEAGELQTGAQMTKELRAALHRYLARTASLLVGVQAEDLLGERGQANLPGTTSEHPNWRRRLTLQLENWADDPQVEALLTGVREERPGTERQAPEPEREPQLRAKIPRATYRVQLHGEFRFADVEQLLPYLDELGVSHVYCSPYLKARAGSKHGYDIVDHNALNPEIGERADFERFCDALAVRGMGHIMDMVPNHMAVTGGDHEWWQDVLENGPASRYADFFDIDWQPLKDELRGKVLLPVLGDHYGNVLDNGELELRFDAAQGRFAVEYFEHRFPIDPREYPRVLEAELELLRARCSAGDPALVLLESLITAFGNLPPCSSVDDDSRQARARDQKLHQQRLADLVADAPEIGSYVEQCLRRFNGDDQYAADRSHLHRLLEAQPYRLAYWRVAAHEINYRRFFDINDLAALRMENAEVFEATHKLVFELIAAGKLQGLRIDHADGLYDPHGYFRAVQQRFGPLPDEQLQTPGALPVYLLAEKILAAGEDLRDDWPVHGTTGYDFANLISRFLVRPDGLDELEVTYTSFIGRQVTYDEILHRCKSLIMRSALASELNVLTAELDRLAEQDPHTRDFGLGGLRDALLETVACFPVYRTYAVDGDVSAEDEAVIERAVGDAMRLSEAADTSVFEFLRDVLLNRVASGRSEALKSRVARFGMWLQQYTGPVAAKGMEDTAFYRYARLISLNEVGGTPEQPAASTERLHAANLERFARWPHSMLASSTHDSKRSEDVRARLHVLSEIPSEWRRHVERWSRINEPLRVNSDGVLRIDRDTEYFLYQTLLGVWPLAPGNDANHSEGDDFLARISAYMVKATKEAKRRTSWLNPDPHYEESLQAFTAALLDAESGAAFMEDFLPFQRRVARLGLYNSLTQLVLKLTCPGVPDLYQGNELWRFDLVDPDNRRPIDFERRRVLLDELRNDFPGGGELVERLMSNAEDGRAKLFVTWRALSMRRDYEALFERGDYISLTVSGELAAHVCAFARNANGTMVIVAVLKWFATLVEDADARLDMSRFGNTSVELPPGERHFVDCFTGASLPPIEGTRVPASVMFAALPVAMWVSRPNEGDCQSLAS